MIDEYLLIGMCPGFIESPFFSRIINASRNINDFTYGCRACITVIRVHISTVRIKTIGKLPLLTSDDCEIADFFSRLNHCLVSTILLPE